MDLIHSLAQYVLIHRESKMLVNNITYLKIRPEIMSIKCEFRTKYFNLKNKKEIYFNIRYFNNLFTTELTHTRTLK